MIGPDGSMLSEFVNVGIEDATRELIGPLPTGRGVLGAVIGGRTSRIRLDDLVETPISRSGFHLITRRCVHSWECRFGRSDETYGRLYLTEKNGGGGFTRDDEIVVQALGWSGRQSPSTTPGCTRLRAAGSDGWKRPAR